MLATRPLRSTCTCSRILPLADGRTSRHSKALRTTHSLPLTRRTARLRGRPVGGSASPWARKCPRPPFAKARRKWVPLHSNSGREASLAGLRCRLDDATRGHTGTGCNSSTILVYTHLRHEWYKNDQKLVLISNKVLVQIKVSNTIFQILFVLICK